MPSDHATPNYGGYGFLVTLIACAIGGLLYFQLDRDLDSLKARAQVAATPQDMLTYMRGLREQMQAHGAASGHAALVLRTPANDLGLHFRAVNGVITRLEAIQALPPESAAYQAGLDDVRGIVRELPEIAPGVFWTQFGWWLAILAFIGWVMVMSS